MPGQFSAFSPDGTTLASAGRMEAKLWDVPTGKLLLNLPHRYYTLAEGESVCTTSRSGVEDTAS